MMAVKLQCQEYQDQREGGDVKSLTTIPKSVGGEIDFMNCVMYIRYQIKFIFQLISGVIVYESVLENADGR